MKGRLTLLLVALLVAGLLAWNSMAIVIREGNQAVITQFGEPVDALTKPGLYFKLPFVQSVVYYDQRLLLYDTTATDIITGDKKTLRIDNYARWRIVDPILFLQAVQTEAAAQPRLDDIIWSELRTQLGTYELMEVVASRREELHTKVTAAANEKARAFGVEIRDVRIKRADLPPENQTAVFERMKSERNRQATQYRSEGAEEAQKLRASAERERAVLLADARRKAEEVRGQGEAEAIKVYNAALSQDPEFYAFLRTLETYRKTLGANSQIVLTPDNELLKYLKSSQP